MRNVVLLYCHQMNYWADNGFYNMKHNHYGICVPILVFFEMNDSPEIRSYLLCSFRYHLPGLNSSRNWKQLKQYLVCSGNINIDNVYKDWIWQVMSCDWIWRTFVCVLIWCVHSWKTLKYRGIIPKIINKLILYYQIIPQFRLRFKI